MKVLLVSLVTALALSAGLSGCGDIDELDISIRFSGVLSERQTGGAPDSPLIGRVCIFGECGDSNSEGRFNFKVYENFRGGNVRVSVRVDGTDSDATFDLTRDADEVDLRLSVDQDSRNLSVDSVNVLKTK